MSCCLVGVRGIGFFLVQVVGNVVWVGERVGCVESHFVLVVCGDVPFALQEEVCDGLLMFCVWFFVCGDW